MILEKLAVYTIDEYIEEIENCPDSELHNRLGIADNYIIDAAGSIEKVQQDMRNNEGFRYSPGEILADDRMTFKYSQGVALLTISKTNGIWTRAPLSTKVSREERDVLKQECKRHNVHFLLNPYLDSEQSDEERYRIFADAVVDVMKYIKQENLPMIATPYADIGCIPVIHTP